MSDDTTPAQTRLSFRWQPWRQKECYQAIHAAVGLGYDTRDALLAVLPQFSVNRLVLALDALIAADAAVISAGRLILIPDLHLLDALVRSPLVLPLEPAECTESVVRDILRRLGIANPAGAMGLLRFDAQSIGGCDGA